MMDAAEILLAQLQVRAVEREREERMRAALTGNCGQLNGAVYEDIVRLLLAFDPEVRCQDLEGDRWRELANRKLGNLPWSNEDRYRLTVNLDVAKFRAQVSAFQNLVMGWIDAAIQKRR